jgi:hypothetical protein
MPCHRGKDDMDVLQASKARVKYAHHDWTHGWSLAEMVRRKAGASLGLHGQLAAFLCGYSVFGDTVMETRLGWSS